MRCASSSVSIDRSTSAGGGGSSVSLPTDLACPPRRSAWRVHSPMPSRHRLRLLRCSPCGICGWAVARAAHRDGITLASIWFHAVPSFHGFLVPRFRRCEAAVVAGQCARGPADLVTRRAVLGASTLRSDVDRSGRPVLAAGWVSWLVWNRRRKRLPTSIAASIVLPHRIWVFSGEPGRSVVAAGCRLTMAPG